MRGAIQSRGIIVLGICCFTMCLLHLMIGSAFAVSVTLTQTQPADPYLPNTTIPFHLEFIDPLGLPPESGAIWREGTVDETPILTENIDDIEAFGTYVTWKMNGVELTDMYSTLNEKMGITELQYVYNLDLQGYASSPGTYNILVEARIRYRGEMDDEIVYPYTPPPDTSGNPQPVQAIAPEITGISWFQDFTLGDTFTIGTESCEPVPEPATMLLLGSGLVGLAGFRKKFRKK